MSVFFELVSARESCRSYADKPVEKEKLVKCIEAARLSPSACNSQPWSFYVVNGGKKRDETAACVQGMGMNKFTDKAPAFIIVCEEKANLSAKLGGAVKDNHFAPIDIGLAVAHICYAATEQGLSTCILGWLDNKKLSRVMGAQKRVRVVVAVGYAADCTLREKKRKTLDEIMVYADE